MNYRKLVWFEVVNCDNAADWERVLDSVREILSRCDGPDAIIYQRDGGTALQNLACACRRLLLALRPDDPDWYDGISGDAQDEATAALKQAESLEDGRVAP